jgi:hypothetical protein
MGKSLAHRTQFKLRALKPLTPDVTSRTAGQVFSFILHPLTQLDVNIDFLFPRFVSIFICEKFSVLFSSFWIRSGIGLHCLFCVTLQSSGCFLTFFIMVNVFTLRR